MKFSAFGLTVLGMALISTSAVQAQTTTPTAKPKTYTSVYKPTQSYLPNQSYLPSQQYSTRSYTNVDAFGNVTTTTVEAPSSIVGEIARQGVYGALPYTGASIGVGSGYYSGFAGYPSYGYGYGYGYPAAYPYPYPNPYPYPAYGYPYPYPAPYAYPPQQQLPVSGPIGIPGYSGPSFTSIPLGNTYYFPDGYFDNYRGGYRRDSNRSSQSVGVGLSTGKPGLSVQYKGSNSSSSTNTTITGP